MVRRLIQRSNKPIRSLPRYVGSIRPSSTTLQHIPLSGARLTSMHGQCTFAQLPSKANARPDLRPYSYCPPHLSSFFFIISYYSILFSRILHCLVVNMVELTWSWRNAALFASLYVAFLLLKAIYRVTLHPLAKFPGPFLAALTYKYEFYFDGIKGGQYTNEIARMHEQYGQQPPL